MDLTPNLESIIYAIETGNSQMGMQYMDDLRRLLDGQKSVAEMTAPAAMCYVLALYLARAEKPYR